MSQSFPGRLSATGGSYAMLPIRIAFAVIFFAHGAQKLFGLFGGGGPVGTGQGFESMGLSPGVPLAILTGLAEVGSSVLLLLGFATRLAAIALITVMVAAVAVVHWPNGFFLNWNITPGKGHGIEYNVAVLGGLLALLIYGAGAASVDRARRRREGPTIVAG